MCVDHKVSQWSSVSLGASNPFKSALLIPLSFSQLVCLGLFPAGTFKSSEHRACRHGAVMRQFHPKNSGIKTNFNKSPTALTASVARGSKVTLITYFWCFSGSRCGSVGIGERPTRHNCSSTSAKRGGATQMDRRHVGNVRVTVCRFEKNQFNK